MKTELEKKYEELIVYLKALTISSSPDEKYETKLINEIDALKGEPEVICAGCNVREPFEHRCHGEGCGCDDPVCMEYQGRITHEELMDIVNASQQGEKDVTDIKKAFKLTGKECY